MGGRLNLDGGTRTPRIPYNLSTACNGLNFLKLNNQSKLLELKFGITWPIQSKKELLLMQT